MQESNIRARKNVLFSLGRVAKLIIFGSKLYKSYTRFLYSVYNQVAFF